MLFRHKELPDLKELPDEEVLALSLTNPDAFSTIVDRYQEAFIRKAKSILVNEEDAFDAVQETFVRIYSAAKRFKTQEGASFKSWGYRILVNQCFTLYQKRKRHSDKAAVLSDEHFELLPDKQGIESYEQKLNRDHILSLVSRLPVMLARIARLYFIEEKPQEEIAEIEGVSVGAVRARIHRAKKELEKINLKLL